MNKLQQMHAAVLLTVVAALALALPALFIKLLMDEISPIGTLAIRFAIAAALFPIIIAILKKEKFHLILEAKTEELERFAFLSFLLCMSSILYFTSFYFINANRAMLVFLMYPIVDSLLALIFLREKISKVDMLTIPMTVSGAFVIFGFNGALTTQSIIGHLLVFIGTFTFSGYLVASRAVAKKYNYYKRTSWLFIFCFFIFCILFFITGDVSIVTHLSQQAWVIIILFATVSTILPYTCLSYAVKYVKSSAASIILVGGSVCGIVLVTIVFNEPFTTTMFIGGALIIASSIISAVAEWEEEGKRLRHYHR